MFFAMIYNYNYIIMIIITIFNIVAGVRGGWGVVLREKIKML